MLHITREQLYISFYDRKHQYKNKLHEHQSDCFNYIRTAAQEVEKVLQQTTHPIFELPRLRGKGLGRNNAGRDVQSER